MKQNKILVLCAITLFTLIQNLSAQVDSNNLLNLNRAAQYFLGSEDEVLIKVNVLGYIRRPGQYMIPRHTDLLSLIAFAGGIVEGANLGKVRILRTPLTNGKGLLSNGNIPEHEALSLNIEKYFQTGETKNIPPLRAGDTVLIPQSAGNKLKNFIGFNGLVSVIVSAATIVIAVDRIKQ